MTALEKEVKLTLFVRHSRGLNLTKQGQEFLELCQDIVGQLAQGTDVIREKDLQSEGLFKFICGPGLLDQILNNLSLFSKKHPNFNLKFSSLSNPYQLQIGDVDATVVLDKLNDPNFIQHPVYKGYVRIYASPKYFQTHPMPKSLSDLQLHKLIFYTGEMTGILNKPMLNDPSLNLTKPYIQVPSMPAMAKALLSGSGIGCYAYNHELVKTGLLVDVFPDMPDHFDVYYYTYHKRLAGSPKIEAFYEFLKEISKIWERRPS